MYKVTCKESPFIWWFLTLEDLLDFCNTLVDNSILYSIIKVRSEYYEYSIHEIEP